MLNIDSEKMREKNSVVVGFGCTPRVDTVKLCDKLTIYFQKQAVSVGGDVNKIELQKNRNSEVTTALVTFADHVAVNSVLSCKNLRMDIDGQEIPLFVEPFSQEEQPTDMEVDDTSFEDLYPEVHSDDDLYSSSSVLPSSSPSSPGSLQIVRGKCSPVESSRTEKAFEAFEDDPLQSFEIVEGAEGHGEMDTSKRCEQFNQQPVRMPQSSSQRYEEHRQSHDASKFVPTTRQTDVSRMPRTKRHDSRAPGTSFIHDESDVHHGKYTDPTSASTSWETAPKRPREMDAFERENVGVQRGEQKEADTHYENVKTTDPTTFQQAGSSYSHSDKFEGGNYQEGRGYRGNGHGNQGKGYGKKGRGNQSGGEGNRGRGQDNGRNGRGYSSRGHGNRGSGHGNTERGHGNRGVGQRVPGRAQPYRQESHKTQYQQDKQESSHPEPSLQESSPRNRQSSNPQPHADSADVNMPQDAYEEKQLSSDEADLNATVEVSKFRPSAGDESCETVLMYFENKRRSGGGKIANYSVNGDTVTITFKDPTAATTVVGRTHVVDGATLTVIPVERKKSRPKRPIDYHRLMLTGIPDGTSEEKLLLFIEGRTKIDEDPEIVYGEIPGTAMLRYSEEIKDIQQVIGNFKKRPLQHMTVCACCVEYPDCILVQDLAPSISEDAVELYFESKRKSGGGVVRDIQLNKEKNQAVVFFEDYKVVNTVVGRQHKLSNTTLNVSAHFEDLGVIVASDGPTPRIPDPIVIQVDPVIAEFVLDNSPYSSRVESEIRNENGKIVWPNEGKASSVKIEPVESASNPSCWIEWKSRVQVRLIELLDEFKSENVNVEEALWDDVCGKLQELNVGNVRPLLKSDQGRIILRGPCAEVENTKTQLDSVVRELEAAAERAKQVITKRVELRDGKFKLLFLCNIKEELDQKWQLDVKITLSSISQEIIFEGMRGEIAEAQIDMYKRFDNLIKHDFEVSPNKVRFVMYVQDKIHEIFTAKRIHAACDRDGNKITIIGATDQDTRRAALFIKNDITETSIAVQNQATIHVLQTAEGRACFEEVNRQKVALAAISGDKGCIEITGFKVDVQQAHDKIQDFIQKNVVLKQLIPLGRGKVRYLMQHAAAELQSISERNQQHTVGIRPQPGGRQSGLTVTGTEQGLKTAVQSLKALTENVVDRQYPVAKPGMPELLKGTKGQRFLGNVARDCSCFIDSNATGDALAEGELGDLVDDVEILRKHTTDSGCHLIVCKGDLTRERVDAIVNAANVDLNHIGGLAGVIVKKGGNSIQRESQDIIKQNGGPLRVAEAVFTGPGNLPCTHIIHVAGPKWERGPPRPGEDPTTEENMLYDSIISVLRVGSRRNLKSISIPAISSGVYGFPLDLCAKTIVEATLDFCRRNKSTNLKEIRFTNINQSACDAFLMVFKAQFGEERKFESLGSADFVGDFGSFSSMQGDYGSLFGATAADFSLPTLSRGNPVTTSVVSAVTPDTVSTKENKTITLKRSDIATENVAIIVNTTGSSMNLRSGGVSNAIAAAAGQALQLECTQVMGQLGISNVAAGDFIETGPGNLNCQNVFHSVCESYRGPGSETMLKSLMQKLLQQANQKGMMSIALPAIGTGTLAFPHDIAAQIMYDEVITFSQQNPAGSLVDIRFVVYHRDQPTIKAFEDEMKRLLQQGPVPTSGQQPAPARPTRKLKNSKKAQLKGTPSTGEEKSFKMLQTSADGSMQMQIGHITVQLQQGDLTKENTDAIVNSAGHNLNLNGPVSKAIVRAGGKEIIKECEKLVKEGKNVNRRPMKTTAGRLPSQSIIHVVTPHSANQLKDVVLKALRFAENDGVRSIAFPALGTGRVGGDPGSAANVLLDGIGEFAVNTTQKSLLLVKVTIFQKSMLSVFADALKAKETASYKPEKGLFRKGFDYVKSAFSSLSGADDGDLIDDGESAEREPDTLILHIFAGNVKNLEEAVERIDDFINEEFTCEELPYEQETWGQLDGSKMDRVFAIATQNKVKIEPLLGGRAKRILIQGRAVDVMKAKADIQEFFTKIQLEEKKQTENQLINTEVQWRYKDYAGIFVDYGEEINPIIERARREKKPSIDLELEEGTIRIDFFTMEEKHLGRKTKTAVHRADLKKEQTFDVPNNWIPMNGQNCVQAQLTQGSQEFVQVQTTFQNSVGRVPNIHRIERIQVLDLYKQYIAKMERIKASLPPGMQAERTLFHGTSEDACDKINRHGFNRSFHGKNGTAHGKGTYFATNASYSDGYAQPSGQNNYKHMYMCKVLTGEYAQGNASLVSPPPKPNKPTEMYDSVVNNMLNPGVFVVFHDAQAYPEYLIVYS